MSDDKKCCCDPCKCTDGVKVCACRCDSERECRCDCSGSCKCDGSC